MFDKVIARTQRTMLLIVVEVIIAASANAASLETYGHLPTLEDVAISPDGTRLAFVSTQGDERLLAVTELATRKLLHGARLGATKLRSIGWADNERLLLLTSSTGIPSGLRNPGVGWFQEWYYLSVYDVTKNKLYAIPNPDKFRDVRLLPVWYGPTMVRHVKGHTVLFFRSMIVSSESHFGLIQADLDDGHEKLLKEGISTTQAWLVDAGGELAAEQDYDAAGQRWAVKTTREGHLREVASGHEAFSPPRLLGFGPEPETLLMEFSESGFPVWRLLSLKDGSLAAPMEERRQLETPIEDETFRLIGGSHLGDDARYVFFDPKMQARWDAILRAFPGERVRLISWTADFTHIVVRVEGPLDGFVYELVDMTSHSASLIGEIYQGLGKPFETRRITYQAGDGLQVPAYLTLPRTATPKRLPLIVLPHGGPASRVSAEFDWWSQALADQGYAVLQPNFRGSNIDPRYLAKGYGQWGRKMQSDLSDGVRYLAKEGIVDPARVCIVGASYGGYAALAGVALESGVYRCAVSVAGISDLRRIMQGAKNTGAILAERDWDRFTGTSGPDDPTLGAISPIEHVAAVDVPVLLIHGRDDTVVPFEQSERIYDALRKAHKEVALVQLKHEDHWLSRSETRLQMLQASVAFLRAHNPPD
jgi:dienelactone hydrolase